MLIIKIVFRQKLTRYGLFGGKPLPAVLITLFGIGIITPLTYFGSKRADLASFYPLVLNAGDSPILFIKGSLFYMRYYIGYEFCFRGYLFMGIKEDVGEWQALGISLIATVLLHVDRPQEEMLMAIISGVAFPIVINRCRSLWPAVFSNAYAGISLDYWIIVRRGGFYYYFTLIIYNRCFLLSLLFHLRIQALCIAVNCSGVSSPSARFHKSRVLIRRRI